VSRTSETTHLHIQSYFSSVRCGADQLFRRVTDAVLDRCGSPKQVIRIGLTGGSDAWFN